MFSFKDSGKKDCRCIAKIEGGKLDGQKIFLHGFEDNVPQGFTNLRIRDKGKIVPVPNLNTREICYVAGPSGSGKSTWASKYIKLYLKMFPECDFIVVSRLNSDKALDYLEPTRVIPEDLEEPLDIHETLQDGDIVLFDDTDTIQDDKIKKAVSKMKNDILETGRHKNIMCIITSHLINGNDRKDTRTVLNECHNMTVFPKAGGAYGIRYALSKYWGMPNKMIDEILQLPSRWVTISKMAPQYVLHEKGATII
jgi:adenosyl cobinamide kinase/adenosyl cobinamide phosphate guanylyltransferase